MHCYQSVISKNQYLPLLVVAHLANPGDNKALKSVPTCKFSLKFGLTFLRYRSFKSSCSP